MLQCVRAKGEWLSDKGDKWGKLGTTGYAHGQIIKTGSLLHASAHKVIPAGLSVKGHTMKR